MSGIHGAQVLHSLGSRGDTSRWIGWLGERSGWKGEKAEQEGKCRIARKFGTGVAKQIYANANYSSFPQE